MTRPLKRYQIRINHRSPVGGLDTHIEVIQSPTLAAAKRYAKDVTHELDGRLVDCFELTGVEG